MYKENMKNKKISYSKIFGIDYVIIGIAQVLPLLINFFFIIP
jgi:hypothetical protein